MRHAITILVLFAAACAMSMLIAAVPRKMEPTRIQRLDAEDICEDFGGLKDVHVNTVRTEIQCNGDLTVVVRNEQEG